MSLVENFGEGATIRYNEPEDRNNPDAGGGPIRRGAVASVPADAGNVVYRSPNAIVPDMEPGGAQVSFRNRMMLPDGRIVYDNSTPNQPFAGAGVVFGDFAKLKTLLQWDQTATLLVSTTVFGIVLGAAASRGNRWSGAGWGLLGGVIGGALLKTTVENNAKSIALRIADAARVVRAESART